MLHMKKIQGSEVRWGIIGVGDVCEKKSAPAMQLIPHSSLVAVMRRNGAKAADYAERHRVPRWYDSAEKLLTDEDINAVYIATPPDSHATYTVQAARAGKPIYVEKPMARTRAECKEMMEICGQYQVPLYVAYYRRTLANFLKVKSLIDEGGIGAIRAVDIKLIKPLDPDIVTSSEGNWRTNPKVGGGGYFYDLASHQLDFLDYVFGPIEQVRGHAGNQAGKYLAEDIVSASYQFANGVLGTGLWCFTAHKTAEEEMTTIIGEKGQIKYQNFGDNRVVLETTDGREVFEFDMPKHIQQPLIQSVVDDLLGVGSCPSTGETGMRTNWVMEQIIKQ